MKKSPVYGLMVAIFVSVSGCGKDVDQSTPQGVAETFKTAAQNEDWSTAFKCLTSESQDLMLMPVAFAGAFAMADESQAKATEMKAIFEKHGVDLKKKKDGFKNVKDKGALFGDYVAWTKTHADDKKAASKDLKKISDVKFENFKIDGDSATCDTGRSKAHFTKIDGKWYIDFGASMKAKSKKGRKHAKL